MTADQYELAREAWRKYGEGKTFYISADEADLNGKA